MAKLDPDQLAALRPLRIAFGFVELLRVVDHDEGQDQGEGATVEDGEEASPPEGS
jgi:hypothetical protein